VATAGYLKLFAPVIFDHYRLCVLNTHPALLPSFPGHARKVLRDTLASGVKVTGATIHFLDEGVDTGPIVFQEPVPVEPDDTADSLHARILAVEHRLFPAAIRLLAEDKLRLDGRRVRIESPRVGAAGSAPPSSDDEASPSWWREG
jgi:phosphoribosylglycinamide formyltransferase-1